MRLKEQLHFQIFNVNIVQENSMKKHFRGMLSIVKRNMNKNKWKTDLDKGTDHRVVKVSIAEEIVIAASIAAFRLEFKATFRAMVVPQVIKTWYPRSMMPKLP